MAMMKHCTCTYLGKYAIIFLCLLCCVVATAQTHYKVVTDSQLNIRTSPSAYASVVGTLQNGSEIGVYGLSNGWAKIKYGNRYAYVSAQFLQELNDSSTDEIVKKEVGNSLEAEHISVKWMACIIIGLIILHIVVIVKGNNSSSGDWYYINLAIFMAASACELDYIAQNRNNNVLWFCTPDEVGWIWTIVNSLLSLSLLGGQCMGLVSAIKSMEDNNRDINLLWCILSTSIGSIASFLAVFFFPNITMYVVVAYLICQFVQIIMIFRAVVPVGGWGEGIYCVFVYTVGIAAADVLFIYILIQLKFLIPYIIGTIIVLFFLAAILQGDEIRKLSSPDSSSERYSRDSCYNCRRLGRCNMRNEYYKSDYICNRHERI
jgi:hypothetical protein